MAKPHEKVYLGYEDEGVSEKTQTLLNYTINKIGGYPDFPPLENVKFNSKCPLCGLHRMQVVQCYAPIEHSTYHRTLYVFACVSPNCWNQSESWLCLRSQYEEPISEINTCVSVAMPSVDSNMTWCNGADEWDENDNGDTANGNVVNVDNAASPNNIQRLSDEEEESISYEMETVEQALGNLQVFDAHNANMSPVQGAVGALGGPVAAAELEGGDEPGLVTVDTPDKPHGDLVELLNQTAELPSDLSNRLLCRSMQFLPKFIYVEEELHRSAATHDDKVTDLLNRYKRENDLEVNIADRGGGGGDEEVYEESAPLHGDSLFHSFVTRLALNPGQIMRYSLTSPPLLGAAIPPPGRCARCGSTLLSELQLLPAFSDTLQLTAYTLSHLHFLSVLIFTCSDSCWQPGDVLVKETVVFQPEI